MDAMKSALRILNLEDNETDAELRRGHDHRALAAGRAGARVDTRADFIAPGLRRRILT